MKKENSFEQQYDIKYVEVLYKKLCTRNFIIFFYIMTFSGIFKESCSIMSDT